MIMARFGLTLGRVSTGKAPRRGGLRGGCGASRSLRDPQSGEHVRVRDLDVERQGVESRGAEVDENASAARTADRAQPPLPIIEHHHLQLDQAPTRRNRSHGTIR